MNRTLTVIPLLGLMLATTPCFAQQTAQDTGPIFLEDQQERRTPAAEDRGAEDVGRTETESTTGVRQTQLSFFEITPNLGAISIFDKTAFTVGTNLSFRLLPNNPLYLEPSVNISFLGGDNNQDATIFHIDGGLRYDFIIGGSAVVPFLKAAIGPSLSSNNQTVVNGETVSDSYFNLFAGGGLKANINPSIGARFDAGVTLQSTDPGLYALGAVALPL